jgi:hypothetical protein
MSEVSLFAGGCVGGIIADVKRRAKHYGSDIRDGLSGQALGSTLFLFFACLAPPIIFGGLMYGKTGGDIGAVEMIAASAFCGVVYAIFSGQPLTILGGTEPMLIFTGILYDYCAPMLDKIPLAVLFGLFLYMGVVSMRGNEFFERLSLWATDPALYSRTHFVRRVPHRVIHGFTLIQASCLGLLWFIKTSAFGILFPLFIGLLVPVRMGLGRLFKAEHLEVLDADE